MLLGRRGVVSRLCVGGVLVVFWCVGGVSVTFAVERIAARQQGAVPASNGERVWDASQQNTGFVFFCAHVCGCRVHRLEHRNF